MIERELFPPQQTVIERGYLNSKEHCFLSMSTGSGKTYLAEVAMEQVVRSGYRAIYLTPLKAIAEQQYERWCDRFGDVNIGVFTGDTAQKGSKASGYKNAQIYIMTPERLDACLRNWRNHWSWIPDIDLIVIDEFHTLGDAKRGPRLEGTITRILRLNPFARILALSATIPNGDELSGWLCGSFFRSTWRQVPIEKKIVRFSASKDKLAIMLGEVSACLKGGGQSLIFANSRSRVQAISEYLTAKGINAAYHHAGLKHDERVKVEQAFRNGRIRALTATSTLEMGLNLPARQIVIYDSYSYTGSGFIPLPVWSFIQRAGRAGRPGLDTAGEVVLMLPKWAGGADKYENEMCEPVVSQLTDSRAMSEQILVDLFAGLSRNRDELMRGFLPLTLYGKQHPEANLNGIINRLQLADMIISHQVEKENGSTTVLKAGLLGRLAVKLMFSPATVALIKAAYKKFDRLYLYDLLLLACVTEDCNPILQANYEDLDQLMDIIQTVPSSFLDTGLEKLKKLLADCPKTLRLLAGIKMAAICYAMTQGADKEELAETFDIYQADIHILKDNVIRLLQGISSIVSAIDKSESDETEDGLVPKDFRTTASVSRMLCDMLQYEIGLDCVGLTRIKGVGGRTAKRLYENGYHSLLDLAQASPHELQKLSGLGKKTAESIVLQAGKLVVAEPEKMYSEEHLSTELGTRTINLAVDPYRLRRSLELVVRGHEGPKFIVSGGRDDHIVIKKNDVYTCDCQDFEKNGPNCKHILCVQRTLGDKDICSMVKRIKEEKNRTIRQALPSLWYSVSVPE